MAEVKDELKEETEETEVKKEAKKETKTKGPKKYLVETPVTNYHGEVAGVHFAYGKAEVYEGHILNWFRKKGYKITAL